MPIRKKVTLNTIAKELGLTVQTVSKAFKGKPGMSEATRQSIFQTAEKLGYCTLDQIRSLRLDHITPYPNDRRRFVLAQTQESVAYNRLLLQGLQDRFFSFGYQIELLMLPRELRERQIAKWIEASGMTYADGIFIAPSIDSEAWESNLFQLQVPKILLNFPPPGVKIDSVIWDVYDAAYQSVAYLHSLGHRRIMYVGDIHKQRGFILRWQAFCYAMDRFGVGVDPALHSTGERTGPKWRDQLMEQMVRHAPTAIICGINDEVPIVYDACRRLGWRVPERISLIGFLNEQPDDSQLPPFTRPLLPIHETGYRAADRMLWRIANPALPFEHIRIHCDLHLGSTSSAPYN
ncbi:LacI family transcriptional regulator [Paenibacillus doosanensis]|uniref:LacI family DNA-binding transcriptional regulator n=1 Tax=Paenibacillus doosanensis TaxID=1229154 RepID=UPI00217F9BE1|nr:LacI family DNA-binding transcriptional regulator [Paenibacillus doosanensis]MCS7462526.1 LacI family transcriptional regulator [Paenibacillus doosanensis]